MKNFKPLLLEILWLIGCVLISYFLFFILLGNFSLDINLHDTYFVLGSKVYLVWFSVLFAFPLYFIKEIRHSFNRKIPFIIFVILGFSFVALIVKASPLLSLLSTPATNGWTIYPPLSVMGKNQNILPKEDFLSYFFTASNVLLAIQILIIALMIFATYKFGKSRNK